MGHELGGKKTGVGPGVVVRMDLDGRESRCARMRFRKKLGIF